MGKVKLFGSFESQKGAKNTIFVQGGLQSPPLMVGLNLRRGGGAATITSPKITMKKPNINISYFLVKVKLKKSRNYRPPDPFSREK